jgi:hypothetical protein
MTVRRQEVDEHAEHEASDAPICGIPAPAHLRGGLYEHRAAVAHSPYHNNFHWHSNAYWDSTEDYHGSSGPSWASAVIGAVSNWGNHALLATNYQPVGNHSGNYMHFYAYDYGDTGWMGAASVYDGWTLCGNQNGTTGACDYGTADNAIFNLNNYYVGAGWDGAGSEAYQKQRTAAHEIGHAYGFNHAPCSSNALMAPSPCWWPDSQAPTNGIHLHDDDHIYEHY